MKSNRLAAYLLGGAAFASSLFIYLEYVHDLGFPDGYITELGYAERRLAYVFIVAGVAFGAWFIYLGRAARQKAIGKQLAAAAILSLTLMIGLFLVDYYYRLHLAAGGGG
ncbi:MAG TPA: hypothetical protein VM870_03595 [Pyrinomonadaceae bacterium]|jgi:hypothetical protein|nr:hypothetical protein [Pyrinomonadaceae bacterium]